MNSISNRIILLVAGLVLASYFLWAGAELGTWWITLESKRSLHQRGQMLRFFVWELCILVWAIGTIIFAHTIRKLTKHERCDGIGTAVEAGAGLICFWFLFGIASGGGNISLLNPSGFLLILGLVPIIFVTKDIFVDLFSPAIKEQERETRLH